MLEDVIEYVQYKGYDNLYAVTFLADGQTYFRTGGRGRGKNILNIAEVELWYKNQGEPVECRKVELGDYIVRDNSGVHLMTASEFQQKYGEVE